MLKSIERINIKEYNEYILSVNNYFIFEKDNPYGHIREFSKLEKSIQIDAYTVISNKSLQLYNKNKLYGSVTDINGNTYDFEIFSDATYRIINIEKYKENVMEVMNERNTNKNS